MGTEGGEARVLRGEGVGGKPAFISLTPSFRQPRHAPHLLPPLGATRLYHMQVPPHPGYDAPHPARTAPTPWPPRRWATTPVRLLCKPRAFTALISVVLVFCLFFPLHLAWALHEPHTTPAPFKGSVRLPSTHLGDILINLSSLYSAVSLMNPGV